MIDIFIAQFTESVSTGFVLNESACIIWIVVGTHGTESKGGTVTPHFTDTTVVGRVRNHDKQCLIQILFSHSWNL